MPSPNLGIEAVSFAYSESLTATRFALTRLDPARRAGRRSGTRKTRPRRVPVVIAGEMGGRGESLRAFGKLPDPMEDRQQVDVGERELRVDEIAAGERLTVCWREMDSNFRFLVARPSNRHGRSDCFLETWSGSVGEREVRIHLPPAGQHRALEN